MIEILPSRHNHTICVEVNGKLTAEDASRVDDHAGKLYGDNNDFNILPKEVFLFKRGQGVAQR